MPEIYATADESRSLWRRIVDFPLVAMLIALLLVIVCLIATFLFAAFVLPPSSRFTFEMRWDLISVPVLIVAYKAVIRHLGERPRDDYRDPHALRHLGLGLGAGLIIFSVAVGIAALFGIYQVKGEGDLSGLLKALIGPALFASVSEELMFRGILFRWLEEFGGSWLALLLTSAFFGAAHLFNPHASPIAALGIALEAGVMLGAAYMLTRSLWLPMGLHAAWNFAQGEVYDIPVSGNPVHGLLRAQLNGPPLLTGNGFGLEASVIAMVVAMLFGLALLWLAIRRGELVKPWWVRRRLGAQSSV